MVVKRTLGWLGLSLATLLITACGEGTSGTTREQRDVGKVTDNTQLSTTGGKSDKKAEAPTLPLVRDVSLKDDFALAIVPDALLTVSLADPAKPSVVNRQVLAKTPLRLAVDGNHAYVACDAGGMQILSVAQPREPKLLGAYAPNSGNVTCVAAQNGLAVVGIPGTGVAVLDVTDPARVVEQKVIPIKDAVTDVVIQDDRAYAVGKALSVISLSKPTEAAIVGTYPVKETLRAVAQHGSSTLVLAKEYLQVLDVRTPERPNRLAELPAKALLSALGGGDVTTTPAPAAAAATTPTSTTPSTEAGAANAVAGIGAASDQPAAKTAVDTAPPAKPAKGKDAKADKTPAPVLPLRVVIDQDRLYMLREGQLYLVSWQGTQTLQPVLRFTDAAKPSAMAAAGSLVVVGSDDGNLTVFNVAKGEATKLSTVSLSTQQTVETTVGAPTGAPVSKAAAEAMQGAPEPTTERPAGAPKPTT